MCGIFGIFNQSNNEPINEAKVDQAVSLMKHRGPDAKGINLISSNIALAHVRLSIIDLSSNSNQPFEYGDYTIIFNGEIFNYIELRNELINEGYSFRTDSDTEVVVACYAHWRGDSVKKFNGMWAFAIYDKLKNKLFCSRDRFGIKPFNYSKENGRFIFSSEIKSILEYDNSFKSPNYDAIANYCRESIGAQNSETWFKNIYRLAPAHNLIITEEEISEERYWDYPTKVTSIDYNQACTEYLDLFEDAVKLRMRSDVPFGATISSGIDSTSIVSVIDKNHNEVLNTYTASFPNRKYDEYPIVDQLSKDLKIDAHRVIVGYDDYVIKLKELIYHIESGHSSPAIYPLNYVNEKAKEDVTVFMEGQGADEILAGYIDTVIIDYALDLLKSGRITKLIRELSIYSKKNSLLNAIILFFRTNSSALIKKWMRRIYGIENVFGEKLKKYQAYDFSYGKRKFDSRLNRRLYEQHQTGLVNLLHYGDAISMLHSLENRLPFMDYRIIEFAFKLPLEYKIKNGLGKYIHRDAMRNILPSYILDNPVKIGFESPLKTLFEDEGPKGALAVLMNDRFLNRKLIKESELHNLIKKHLNGDRDYSRFLYRLLSLELWFQVFIDQEKKIDESINFAK